MSDFSCEVRNDPQGVPMASERSVSGVFTLRYIVVSRRVVKHCLCIDTIPYEARCNQHLFVAHSLLPRK